MNRPIYFIELKTPNQALSLKELVRRQLSKVNEPENRIQPSEWAVYCNDRLAKTWNLTLRPRSKVLLVARFAPKISLNVAHESNQIIVVDKISGLPTQKTLKSFEDNLYDQVRVHYIQKKSFPVGLPYVGLHHRLDRDTSGLVLMTKQRQINKEVSDLFKNRKIKKQYLAHVEWGDGKLPDRWRQKDLIRRGSVRKQKFFFEVGEGGDEALSEFQVLEAIEGSHYLLRCFPLTGRTHQLRVQLAHKGHPILGDRVYGTKTKAPRLMLHAERLNFTLKGKEVEVTSTSEFNRA